MPALKSRFATRQLEAAAALTGQGAALLTPEFFRLKIDSGRLIPLSPLRLMNVESYYWSAGGTARRAEDQGLTGGLQRELAVDKAYSPPMAGGGAVGTPAIDR
jgi:hypothetical protein